MQTIVVQDADESIREVIKMALEAEGFNVAVSETYGRDLLLLIRKANPVLVLLDFRLSGEESINMCRMINAGFPGLFVLATSCNSRIGAIYRDHGFDCYLEKPFDLETLSREVWQCIYLGKQFHNMPMG